MPLILMAQSTNQNYILSKTYQNSAGTSSLDVIQYFDGLGRPVETVQKVITPSGADFVSLKGYDNLGRDSINWLPIVSPNSGGAYVTPTSITGGSPKTYYDYDIKPYTKTEYENSPLSRIIGQYGAGNAWYANSKKVITGYQLNSGSEVLYYFVNSSNQLERNGTYAANSLYKTVVTDEDGKQVTEFKDKLGRVVMKQSSTDVKTYYIYNDLGQLSYVLPPIATDSLPASGVISDEHGVIKRYAYLYKYDERGNNTRKRLPGCDSISMIYDKSDRLILSQDGNQRTTNTKKSYIQWTVTKYDVLGRVLYSGILNRDIQASERILFKNNVITESYNGSSGFSNTGYSCNYFANEIKPLLVNYYDNYGFRKMQTQIDSTKLIYSTLTGYDAQYTNAKGLLTGMRTYILDKTGTYLVSVMYYDDKGRVVQTRSSNQLGGYDIVYNHYDFTGRVLTNRKEHNTTVQTMMPEVYTYNYDNAGRPTTTYYQFSTKPTVLQSNRFYDALGRLSVNYRHASTDTVSYTYNVRNCVSTIKNGSFKEELFYNTSNLCFNLSPCYNGNIAASTWTYNGIKKAYVYTYDQLNRLTLATGYQTSGCSLYAPNNREQFSYDKQGNIAMLWRDKDYTCMDFLQMSYIGNQIKSISDFGTQQNLSTVKEYINNANLSTEFLYDKNGNMTKDYDRKIVTIRYNILNLPDTIQFSTGNQIINRYAADGRKLGTEYFTRLIDTSIPMDKDSVCNWTYIANITNQSGNVYIGNMDYQTSNGNPTLTTLIRLKNTEGYVSKFGQYFYNRYDHLGNVREVWYANTNSAYQRTQYYPSGVPWASNTGDNPSYVPYKYNNKEFVEMNGWDETDLGARGLHHAKFRFDGLDALSEKHYDTSPYAVCGNNPVNRIDPNGMDWFQNDQTGDVVYVSKLQQGDEKNMEKGWQWMGENGMFKSDENDAANSGNALALKNGGDLQVIENNPITPNDNQVVVSMTLEGDKATKFMGDRGYDFKPTQQIRCENEINFHPESGITAVTGGKTYITEKSAYVPKGSIEDVYTPLNDLLYKHNYTVNRFQITYTTNIIKKGLDSLMPFIGYYDQRIPTVYPSLSAYPRNNKLINTFLRTNPSASK